jgi:exosortase
MDDMGGIAAGREVRDPDEPGSVVDPATTKRVPLTSLHGLIKFWREAPMSRRIAFIFLIFGMLAIAIPTLVFVAKEAWSTEQGAHGPIVLLTGLWLVARTWKQALPIESPPIWRFIALLIPVLAMFLVARISQIVEVEGYLMYAAILTILYGFVGARFLRKMAAPIIYLAFIFPPPETLVYAVTLPMKIAISESAVFVLSLLNYPIGHTGVWIQIGQYQLLVAAACSGLNSIVSLTVLGTFYIYMRHEARGLRSLLLLLLIVPVAMLANFIRVLILILLTYHSGESVAQGFMHNFAGLTMFAAALISLYAADLMIGSLIDRFKRRSPQLTEAKA